MSWLRYLEVCGLREKSAGSKFCQFWTFELYDDLVDPRISSGKKLLMRVWYLQNLTLAFRLSNTDSDHFILAEVISFPDGIDKHDKLRSCRLYGTSCDSHETVRTFKLWQRHCSASAKSTNPFEVRTASAETGQTFEDSKISLKSVETNRATKSQEMSCPNLQTR